MLCSLLPTAALAADGPAAGGTIISEGGVYQISENATGIITISTSDPVTLKGQGSISYNAATQTMSVTPYSELYIKCTVPVVLTLQDVFISNANGTANTIDFTGAGNKLYISGTCVLDHNCNVSGWAALHVNETTELTIDAASGGGSFYLYKREQGAGIGGNGNVDGRADVSGEFNGAITLGESSASQLHMFAKGSKQGALIGAGANSSANPNIPGEITINGGEYNLMSISRGGVIGGSAGTGGASAGTVVNINGGTININVDYSGSAIGGGGYNAGNDASGGTVYINGGSLRTFIDKNAYVSDGDVNLWATYGVTNWGVHGAIITAEKKNSGGSPVYLLVFDTDSLATPANSFLVKLDGKQIYSGGLHSYSYVNEGEQKADQSAIAATMANWASSEEDRLFFYATAGTHTLEVNGEQFEYKFDLTLATTEAAKTTGAFTVTPAQTGDYTVTAQPATGLSLRLSASSANEGDIVTITPELENGYELLSLQWKTEAGGEDTWASVTSLSGQYLLQMPAANVVIKAETKSVPKLVNGVYELNSAEHLRWFAETVNGGETGIDAKVMTDIDVSDADWTPVLNYAGTFDGNHKTITLKIGSSETPASVNYQGLFGSLASATVKDVTVAGAIYASGSYVGGVVGCGLQGYSSVISGCTNKAVIVSTNSNVGGIAGAAWRGNLELTNCVNEGAVSGKQVVGGILGNGGYNNNSAAPNTVNIADCKNTGTVSATGSNAGGIVGSYATAGAIERCINSAAVSSGATGAGGIVGNMTSTVGGIVSECANKGAVSGTFSVGGVAGTSSSPLRNCYNTGAVSATAKSTGSGAGGIAGTMSNAKSALINCWNAGEVIGIEGMTCLGGLAGYVGNAGVTLETGAYLKESASALEAYVLKSALVLTNPPADGALAAKTDAEMKAAEFLSVANGTGRSFVSNGEDALPVLRWEKGADTATLQTVEVTTQPSKTTYMSGEVFDETGMEIYARYSDGTSMKLYDGYTISPTGGLSAGETGGTVQVTVSYGGKNAAVDVTVGAEPGKDADGFYLLDSQDDWDWFVFQNDTLGNTALNVRLAMDGITVAAPIAPKSTLAFKGIFDGNGKSISLNITSTTYGALFGYVNGGTIKRLTVTGTVANADGQGGRLAGIAGQLKAGTVEDCVNSAAITLTTTSSWGGGEYGGGIAGEMSGASKIIRCTNNGAVSGSSSIGGIVGSASGGEITDCVNTAKITSDGYVGGIAGASSAAISGCTNQGEVVSTDDYAAGIVARANSGSVISNCVNEAKITGIDMTGGIVSYIMGASSVEYCVNQGEVSSTGMQVGGGVAYCSADSSTILRGIVNHGAVSGTVVVGGVFGYYYNSAQTASASVSDCYNTGAVTASGPVVAAGTYDSEYNGAGGVAGQVKSYQSTIERVYSSGTVTVTAAEVASGGVVGCYSDLGPSSLMTSGALKNAFYLTGTAAKGVGSSPTGGGLTDESAVKTAEELKADTMPALLNGTSGSAFVMAPAGENSGYPVLKWQVMSTVSFELTPDTATVELKDGENQLVTPETDGSYLLTKGSAYTYTVSASGYINKSGSITPTRNETIAIALEPSGGGTGGVVTGPDTTGMDLLTSIWDGTSVDVSWYIGNENSSAYTIDTAAKLAGVAALVNGLVNSDCRVYTGEAVMPASQWNTSSYVKHSTGTSGENNLSTNDYSYGITDFSGKTITLAKDMDMSAGNYMPIGGQYLMTKNLASTKLGSSFCGLFDGGEHSVTIACDRHCSTGNFGDGQSVGLIGRLGVHDNDPADMRPSGAGVCNVAVYGSVYGNRSVGGIVGKIGKTNGGATIENCANFAAVSNTDAKGCGGIVGAGWNGGVVRNCYNAGKISSTYVCPTGGISGSNEISLENCYNIGQISARQTSYAMAIGTNNGGAPASVVKNCFYLKDSAPGGGYYTNSTAENSGERTSAQLKDITILQALGSAFAKDTKNMNGGYPVLAWQNPGAPTGADGAPAVTDDITVTVTNVPATTQTGADGGVTANAAPTQSAVAKAVTDAVKAADDAGTKAGVELKATGDEKAIETVLTIPTQPVKDMAANSKVVELIVTTNNGSLTLDETALESLASQAAGSSIVVDVKSATEAEAKSAIAAANGLSENDVELASSIVVDVTVSSNGKPIANYSGTLTVGVPVDAEKFAEGGSYKVVVIHSDKSVETLNGKCVKVDGKLVVQVTVKKLSTFIVSGEKAAGYTDVALDAWYYDAVTYVSGKGLMGGVGENKFDPSGTLTRAMMVTVLYRLEGTPAVTEAASFTDVPAGQWYSDAIAWAEDNKIVDGYGNGVFGPSDSITREQMAAILLRYSDYKGYDLTKSIDLAAYTDAGSVSSWALDAMKWANAEGLITGRSATTLVPGGTATRAEVAAILMRFCENIAK